MATKHYTGMTGVLFREAREKEMEQAVHRIRPVLAESTKSVYILSNVPTNLPVDSLHSFNEWLPASLTDTAEQLLAAARETSTDSFTQSELQTLLSEHGIEMSRSTISRRVRELIEHGCLTEESQGQEKRYHLRK